MEIYNPLVALKDKNSCVYILALGGTITSIASESTDDFYHTSSKDIHELVDSLPLDDEKINVVCEQIEHHISHDITNESILYLARKVNELVHRDDIIGIVITQGTNCIEEISYFISLVIQTKKTIVFTGAFRPMNALGYDGSRNLYNAILIASDLTLTRMGVILTFNDCLISARDAIKINPSVIGDFSYNGSGIMGLIQAKKAYIHHTSQHRHTYLSEFNINAFHAFSNICIIYGHFGMNAIFVRAAIENNVHGIISAGMGKGYQPKEVTLALYEASKKGIHVVRCSRTGQGMIKREKKHDDEHNFITGGSLSPQKARILLAVALSTTQNTTEIQRIFDQY